jgi:ArsR family transcriptional regulator
MDIMDSKPSDELTLTPSARCCTFQTSLRLPQSEAAGLAEMFKAMGHPVRVQIVDLLSRFGGQVCVCDIEAHFALSQPTISHHLRVLRQAGLVEAEQRGLWVYYVTAPEGLARLRRYLSALAHQDASDD